MGDFNSITSEVEANYNQNFSLQKCADFVDWIYEEELIYLGFTGQKHTWARGQEDKKYKVAR